MMIYMRHRLKAASASAKTIPFSCVAYCCVTALSPEYKQVCPEIQVIRRTRISISIRKCSLALFPNFNFTRVWESWKTLDSNDQNQIVDHRFSLKQWFARGAQSRRLRKPWLWSLLFKVFRASTLSQANFICI